VRKRSQDERAQRKKTYVYGCGGHIRKGKSVCSLGAVPQPVLERAVVDAVVAFYEPLRGKGSRERIVATLRTQLETDAQTIEAKRDEAVKRLKKLDRTMRNLLDNLTARNRDVVDRRIDELERDRNAADQQIEALDHTALSMAEVDSCAAEVAEFTASLEQILCAGHPDERKAALRRCIATISVHTETRTGTVRVRKLPVAFGVEHGAEFQQLEVRW